MVTLGPAQNNCGIQNATRNTEYRLLIWKCISLTLPAAPLPIVDMQNSLRTHCLWTEHNHHSSMCRCRGWYLKFSAHEGRMSNCSSHHNARCAGEVQVTMSPTPYQKWIPINFGYKSTNLSTRSPGMHLFHPEGTMGTLLRKCVF